MSLSTLTIEELQSLGQAGDESAILELGRRVLEFDFCLTEQSRIYCEHAFELQTLEEHLNAEVPPDCPRCGHWLTEK